MTLVGDFSTCTELERAVTQGESDIILVGTEDSWLSTRALLNGLMQFPRTSKIILFYESSAEETETNQKWLLQAGVKGAVSKGQPLHLLPRAIRAVHGGSLWYQRRVIETGLHSLMRAQDQRLTAREERIVRLICQGKSNKHIAFDIHLSQASVALSLTQVYRKLGISDRTQLLLLMQRHSQRSMSA
jgi:DNA-binding NarL/FixJ family response regulator